MKLGILFLFLSTLAFATATLGQTPAATPPALTALGTNQPPPTPPSDLKSISYALGVYAGGVITNSLHRLGTSNIDEQVVLGAIKELLDGQPAHITQTQMVATLNHWQDMVQAENSLRNSKAGQAYMEKFAKEAGVKELANGVLYQVIKEGDGPLPKLTDTVTVNYRGTLPDGTEFENSYGRVPPAEMRVGGVIQGWTEALQAMKVGSKWKLAIPAAMAYGLRGTPSIQPNTTLIFELELLSIKAPPAPPPGAADPSVPTPGMPNAAQGTSGGSNSIPVVTGQIIRVPSADEMKQGRQIEVIDGGKTNVVNGK